MFVEEIEIQEEKIVASKKEENQKRDFSKTELSFESGAHFESGGAKGRPRGAQKVHREPKGGPSKAQGGQRAKGSPKEGQERRSGGPKGAQGSPKGGPREAQGAPKDGEGEAKRCQRRPRQAITRWILTWAVSRST